MKADIKLKQIRRDSWIFRIASAFAIAVLAPHIWHQGELSVRIFDAVSVCFLLVMTPYFEYQTWRLTQTLSKRRR